MRKNTQLIFFLKKPKTLKFFEGRKQIKPFEHRPLKNRCINKQLTGLATDIQQSSRERTKPLCLWCPHMEIITLPAQCLTWHHGPGRTERMVCSQRATHRIYELKASIWAWIRSHCRLHDLDLDLETHEQSEHTHALSIASGNKLLLLCFTPDELSLPHLLLCQRSFVFPSLH